MWLANKCGQYHQVQRRKSLSYSHHPESPFLFGIYFSSLSFCFSGNRIKSAVYTKVRGRSRIVDGEFRSERTFAGSFRRGAMNEVVQEEGPNTCEQSLGRSRGSSTTDLGLKVHPPLHKSRRFTPPCTAQGQRKDFVSSCVNSLLPRHPHSRIPQTLFPIYYPVSPAEFSSPGVGDTRPILPHHKALLLPEVISGEKLNIAEE